MQKHLTYLSIAISVLLQAACSSSTTPRGTANHQQTYSVKPINGTWINLVYQDGRNKYTNPQHFDNTDPHLWSQKIEELSQMGVEYLVFMAVANEEKSFYPSKLMKWAYPANRKSPVDAIMDKAAEKNMKVFMSTGWAKNQDDNLRDPAIKQRQLDIMKELANLYGNHPALYGWYLPVEDCLCPLLSEHAIASVNVLTNQARSLTPDKKILISPYGIVNSDFANPEYEKRLAKLKVDIIAYQDEVGCVREALPIPRLKHNWQKLHDIHSRLNIAMWANCETFTWEHGTNDRTSALIPAAYPRLLSQQVAASTAGVENIISFMLCGIFENPSSPYQLGQPVWSGKIYKDYMDWKEGHRFWKLQEAAFLGKLSNSIEAKTANIPTRLFDNHIAEENTADTCWVRYGKGHNEIQIDLHKETLITEIMIRLLNYKSGNITIPTESYLWASNNGKDWELLQTKDVPYFPNNNHDAWIEAIYFNHFTTNTRYLKFEFKANTNVYIDEFYINPKIDQY